MENLYEIPTDELSMTFRALVKILQEKRWPKATIIRGDKSFLELTRPDGKTMRMHFLTSPDTSYFSGLIATDKLASYHLLEKVGAKQPETWILPRNDLKRKELIEGMLSRHEKIVIKPIDGAHGNGVFTGITLYDEATKAIEANSEASKIIVQEQVFADEPEVRVICIGYKFIAAYARIPAHVVGDGVHTVLELIDIENKTKRTPAYQSNLSYIKKDVAEEYIKKNNIENYIPVKNEKVQVVGVCNTGNGGTMEDVSEKFSPRLRELSEKIAREFELPVIGIDFFGENIIEVNSAPALYHPVDGPASTICVEKYVEMISEI